MNTQLVELPFVPVVNRVKEIEAATHRLERMLADLAVPDCVLFFYGVSSAGKTTLLHEIRRESAKRGVPSALVDFDREPFVDDPKMADRYDGPRGRVKVAEQLMNELARTSDFVPGRPIGPDLSPDEAADRLFGFALDLYRFSQRRPTGLFFDTIEDSDPETLLWVEERILAPFLSQFHILIVMAGRAHPNTIQRDLIYPLERRTREYHLLPFDSRQTDEQLAALGAKDLALRGADLAHYTGGLPGLNDAAARWLVKKRSVDQLLPHLVDDIIFERLASQVMSLDVKEEILAVSVLRQFDSGLLGRLVRTLWPEKYPAPGIGPVRVLLKHLQQTRLVEPHPDGYGYVVPHDLRVVLDAYWQQTQPQEHFRVHQIAARWFDEQVEQEDYVAIADRLYHLGGLWRDVRHYPYLDDQLEPDLRPDEISTFDRLARELQAALEAIRESSLRAFDLANKTKNVLKQREFELVLEHEDIEELVDMCEAFNHTLR